MNYLNVLIKNYGTWSEANKQTHTYAMLVWGSLRLTRLLTGGTINFDRQ